MAANRTQDTTFLGARCRRLARYIDKLKAWSPSNTPSWQRSDTRPIREHRLPQPRRRLPRHTRPQRAVRRITHGANRLGYTVRFDTARAAW